MPDMVYSHPSLHTAATAARILDRAAHVVTTDLLPDVKDVPPSPPEWVMLIPAGVFSGRDGRGPYTLDAAAVIDAFERGGIDLPIDYDHQTLDASDKTGPVPAAGWIKELDVREGILWGRVAWTPKAAGLIAAREYRFLSPVFRHDKQGRVVALEGAGLTHYPNLDLEPVAHQKGDDMTDLTPIADALGVEGDTSVAALAAHAARLKESASRPPDPAEWVPMAQHKTVAEELAKMQAEAAAREAERLVAAAMSAGKLAPALKDWAMSYATKYPDAFADWTAKAPVVVAADAGHVASNARTEDGLTEEDRIACRLLGMAESDFAAHKKTIVHA